MINSFVFLSSIILSAWIGNVISISTSTNSTPWLQSSAPKLDWEDIDHDGTGTLVAAVARSGTSMNSSGIYISKDSGKTFTSIPPIESADSGWTAVQVTHLGIIWALQDKNGLFSSTNQGKSWTHYPVELTTPLRYSDFAVSDSDAKIIYVLAYPGTVYVSKDTGVSFTGLFKVLPSEYWNSISTSSTGQYAVLTSAQMTDQPGTIYVTSNYGSSWTQPIMGNINWYSVHYSANGNYAFAAAAGSSSTGGIYVSSLNHGAAWVRTATDMGLYNWRSVTSDYYGKVIAAAVGDGNVYVSWDHGASWKKSSSAPSGEMWRAISCDDTGEEEWAIVSYTEGKIYYGSSGVN